MNARRESVFDADEERAAHNMPDILYVMGTGRSGTTILEILLANESRSSGTGELKHIFRDGYMRNLSCACGKAGRQCELWSSVMREARWDPHDWGALARLIDRNESHARFPLVAAGRIDRETLDAYRAVNETLFKSISRVTHSELIVDSSKYPARALLLASSFPGRVKVLCITRSAAGLIAAFRKKNEGEQYPKSFIEAALYYVYVLICMKIVRRRLGSDCFSIRFEDLNRDPISVLSAIERWSGYSFAIAKTKIAQGGLFDVGHIVTGNRLRKKGRVRFEPKAAETTRPAKRGLSSVAIALLERLRALLGF